MIEGPPAQAFLPARRAPLVYFGFAHACLFVACTVLALRAGELSGFYYHPRLIAVVHLVTLGFISSSIFGALYLVCPLAFRMPLPERRLDLWAAGSWIVAVSGIASHFWLERYSGMAWAGGMALLTPFWLGGRVIAGLRTAPVAIEAKLPVALAIVNLGMAGTLGVLLGIHKHRPLFPFAQLDGVHAHLHLAAVGFATLMVVGAGYRILPMVFPAAMPRGRLALAAGLIIEAGVVGLATALLFAKPAVAGFTCLTLAGIGGFVSRVAYMLRNRRPAPSERPRPDWSCWLVLQALGYLLVSGGLGLSLALLPTSETTLRIAVAYGVCGLLGFLSQLIVGVELRLVPLASWLQGFAAGGYQALPPPQHSVLAQPAIAAVVALWTTGVPALVVGLALERSSATAVGAGLLAAATLLNGISGGRAVGRLRRPPSPPVHV